MIKRTLRSVDIGDHVTSLQRYFLVIQDDPSGPSVMAISARLVTFLGELLAQPNLLTVGPVVTPHYSISHDGERWILRGEGESSS